MVERSGPSVAESRRANPANAQPLPVSALGRVSVFRLDLPSKESAKEFAGPELVVMLPFTRNGLPPARLERAKLVGDQFPRSKWTKRFVPMKASGVFGDASVNLIAV